MAIPGLNFIFELLKALVKSWQKEQNKLKSKGIDTKQYLSQMQKDMALLNKQKLLDTNQMGKIMKTINELKQPPKIKNKDEYFQKFDSCFSLFSDMTRNNNPDDPDVKAGLLGNGYNQIPFKFLNTDTTMFGRGMLYSIVIDAYNELHIFENGNKIKTAIKSTIPIDEKIRISINAIPNDKDRASILSMLVQGNKQDIIWNKIKLITPLYDTNWKVKQWPSFW